MRPGVTHVVSKGSNIWLDDEAMQYLRLPKHEGPREKAEWSDHRAGPLEDAVWHPMSGWRIGRPDGLPEGEGFWLPDGLMIAWPDADGTTRSAWFPNAAIVGTSK